MQRCKDEQPEHDCWFTGTLPIATKLILIPIQYLVMRRIVRRRAAASIGAAALVD